MEGFANRGVLHRGGLQPVRHAGKTLTPMETPTLTNFRKAKSVLPLVGLLTIAAVPAQVVVFGSSAQGAPLVHYVMDEPHIEEGAGVRDLNNGKLAAFQGEPVPLDGPGQPHLYFPGEASLLVEAAVPAGSPLLPAQQFTVSAWVALHESTDWGGIVSCMEDTGSFEKGWVLGYNNDAFTFAVSTQGADDGDGVLTYLRAAQGLGLRKWTHVAGTYDGATMRIYLDGQLAASSTAQSGPLLYPPAPPLAIAAYRDSNEYFPLKGRVHEVQVLDTALDAEAVQQLFAQKASLVDVPVPGDPAVEFVVSPYLQAMGETTMTVRWETAGNGPSRVAYGTALPLVLEASGNNGPYHEVVLSGLLPGTQYHYQVVADSGIPNMPAKGPVLQFRTAPSGAEAFDFVVICDTQANPAALRRVATHAYSHRPAFTLLGGDLVSTGADKDHWTGHFFPNMEPLNNRVPLVPALGNHEGDAQFYYDYFSLPAPEYFHKFSYGNLDVFIVDSQRDVSPGSEQHTWLDQQMGASTATWKILMFHKPPYSSDENDYGDTYVGQSAGGDLRMRPLADLADAHDVDVVWNGHIHTYERTFPIRGGEVVAGGEGPIYMITGGGGGGLENAAPTPSWFSAQTRRTHHYCHVTVNHGVMRILAYDDDGMLFDSVELRKAP